MMKTVIATSFLRRTCTSTIDFIDAAPQDIPSAGMAKVNWSE
jgi:hypothetical protein